MFCVVWNYPNLKLKDKQYKQKTSPQSYKTGIKIIANNQTSSSPALSFSFLRFGYLFSKCFIFEVWWLPLLVLRWLPLHLNAFLSLIGHVLLSSLFSTSSLVHFFAVLCKTTTWNGQVLRILENVYRNGYFFISFSDIDSCRCVFSLGKFLDR